LLAFHLIMHPSLSRIRNLFNLVEPPPSSHSV